MKDRFSILEEEPKKEYSKIENNGVFIGCVIKTEYDEERIQINKNYNPKRIKNNENFLFGCLFEPNKRDSNVINRIKKYNNIDLYMYDKILQENNLSCNQNFSYFKNILYPIDSNTISDYISNFNYEDFFEKNEEVPLYESLKSVNMFFLFPDLLP